MMKSFIFTALLSLSSVVSNPLAVSFEIGDKAPQSSLKLKDVASDSMMSLSEATSDNGLLVIFSCNTCPFVIAWEDQYPQLGELTENNKVGMVLVNSNEAKRDNEDSYEAMKAHFNEANYNTPYLLDENSILADAFGAQTTPHVYLFNKDLELVYKGSINDKFEARDKKASKFYLADAINQLVKNEPIEPAETREIGCSIKRVKS